ncbi:three-Cys-motif partner protein [Methylophilus rhizosphaerae]|uniref:Three-Cys-motif partner protein n=1 Tax=Methylophilus rhizosphaerae TaxID=492660 RepID=A0A1G9CQ55_9PROT|nr:three-Cys-motif partner protein TcmP [Methylophilus rhizosphaerae]SDK53747.1 three-Cys-motif partner protein [Methylophilus rhizosphaerae]
MPKNQYDYKNQPLIGYHSVIKHKILRDYLKAYIETLTRNVRIDNFKLAVVDGFAGGGKYRADWGSETVYGSPINILEACNEAAIKAQSIRLKPFLLDTKFYFVEEDKAGYQLLNSTLIEKGYAERVNNDSDIYLFNDDFKLKVFEIVDDIKKRSATARSFFLLDQYGYSDVPFSQINHIFSELPGAEILLTFNVDALLNYLNEKNLRDFHRNTGFNIEPLLDSGLHNKDTRPHDWRLAAQAILHKNLINGCFPDGHGHHTTFYIRSTGGHGDYWLVHLSRNITARNVMVDIHWLHGNHFVHYGSSGLDMYNLRGFNLKADSDFFGFNADARTSTLNNLYCQIPKLIHDHHRDGITFQNLQIEQANYTPARSADILEAFQSYDVRREILVMSPDGKLRGSKTLPKPSDIILPNPQLHFLI